jgi:hypothetical protein
VKIRVLIGSLFLAATLFVAACVVPAWVNAVEADVEIAVPIAASLITVIDPALAPLVNAVVAGLNALEKVLDTYKSSQTATNLQAVQAAMNAVNANIAQLESAAQIHNPGTDAKITAIVGLLTQLSAAIISEVPAPTGTTAPLKTSVHNAAWFKAQYNLIVAGDSRFTPLP